MAKDWSPSSWHAHTANQQPDWPDEGDLDRALKQIGSYPPLVFAGEARSLQSSLAKVAAGNARSCCRPATAPRASRSSRRSTSVRSCAPSCRWRSCSPTAWACRW
ncbi:MAG: 3-deoxy-7-phosphoheptulonate synthase [Ilumatobacteraceae bacterium]